MYGAFSNVVAQTVFLHCVGKEVYHTETEDAGNEVQTLNISITSIFFIILH